MESTADVGIKYWLKALLWRYSCFISFLYAQSLCLGVISALAMAVGTGLTLSLFAYLVIIARNKAVKVSQWYFSAQINRNIVWILKFTLGLALILFGMVLFHSSFIDAGTGVFFKR